MSGAFHEIGHPHFKSQTDLKEQLGISDGDQVAWLRRIGVFVLVAFQQRSHANMGPSHLLDQIFLGQESSRPRSAVRWRLRPPANPRGTSHSRG